MRKIRWWSETGMVGGNRSDFIEVEDDATDEEVEHEVKEAVFNSFSWGWEDVSTNEEPSDAE